MKRREFLGFLGGAAVATIGRPCVANAQQVPVVGFLSTRSPEEAAAHTAAFIRGLKEVGLVDGQNVAIEYRWARGQYQRLPAFAAELADLRAAVIAAAGDPSALAAKAATRTIPITFIIGDDPERVGLVTSLARPGGNATGVSQSWLGLSEQLFRFDKWNVCRV